MTIVMPLPVRLTLMVCSPVAVFAQQEPRPQALRSQKPLQPPRRETPVRSLSSDQAPETGRIRIPDPAFGGILIRCIAFIPFRRGTVAQWVLPALTVLLALPKIKEENSIHFL